MEPLRSVRSVTAHHHQHHPSIPFPGESRPTSPRQMIKTQQPREYGGRDDPYRELPAPAPAPAGHGREHRREYRVRTVASNDERDDVYARREERERQRKYEEQRHILRERERERERDEAAARERTEKERERREKETKEKEKEKQPDPKKREQARPPQTIVDKDKGAHYRRIGFLGEGGFARVYEVIDDAHEHRAVKVVNKANIKSKRNKTKLWAEIKLHQMLKHPNIVAFDECFEDDDNVYMILELCHNGSLMDLLRRRKRYTEGEARFYLVQIIGACQYMQDTNVIHRDLKLGNIFLDSNMNIKVGDFGLAALIENPGDRKKTICGTPNYIAPEVLFDTANGHSFEVDVWSVGVILYTLLIGKPPFQTKEVKAIYRRIRENRYEFPEDKEISASAQNLIMSILNTDPQERPTLEEILKHQWFVDGPFPSHIPISSNDTAPDFANLSTSVSRRNFDAVARRARGIESTTTPPHPPRGADALGPSILAQERDFKAAVEPGSPISALLNSARQPLVQAPAGIKNGSLLRKLTEAGAASTLSPVRRGTAPRLPAPGPSSRANVMDDVVEDEEEDEGVEVAPPVRPVRRDRELEQQKARIVSDMASLRIREREEKGAEGQERKALGETVLPQSIPAAVDSAVPTLKLATRGDAYERLEANLTEALGAWKSHGGCRLPDGAGSKHPPRVFVVSWLDYCAKYGMGFAMSDGTVSVHFNDSSSLALAPAKRHADYVDERARCVNFALSSPPEHLTNKIFLLHKFEGYMLSRLCGTYDYTFEDVARTSRLVYVEKYLRTKNVILFRLSNGILQFNFYDHTKLILSDDGLVVSIIDKHYAMHSWTLESLLRLPEGEKERHKHEKYIAKVDYARSLLARMRAHGGMSATAARVQEKENERAKSKESGREREREPREARQPIRG